MCLSKLIKLYTKKDKFYCAYLNEHDLKKKSFDIKKNIEGLLKKQFWKS